MKTPSIAGSRKFTANSLRLGRCLVAVSCIVPLTQASKGLAAEGQTFAHRLYLTSDLGAAFLGDAKLESSDPFINGARLKFDPGVRLDLAFGYHFTDWLAAEFNLGATFDYTKNAPGDGSDSWMFYQIPMMANVVVNIPTRSRFRPFVGGGVGGVESQLEDYDSFFFDRTDEDFGWAWQGFAGCRYQVASRVEVGVVYRYMGTTERSFNAFYFKMEGVHTHSVSASISLNL